MGVIWLSALSLLLFYTFMPGMFLALNFNYLTDYANDNTLFVVGDNIVDTVHSLMRPGENLFFDTIRL